MLPISDHVYLLEKAKHSFKRNAEPVLTVDPNKRLHNFPLQEKVTSGAAAPLALTLQVP